jgi:glycoside/pentoside/hexuronide:cation symporter, GPH family
MVPELSSDYDERSTITGIRMSFSFMGNLFAAAGVALLMDVVFGGADNYREGYSNMKESSI